MWQHVWYLQHFCLNNNVCPASDWKPVRRHKPSTYQGGRHFEPSIADAQHRVQMRIAAACRRPGICRGGGAPNGDHSRGD